MQSRVTYWVNSPLEEITPAAQLFFKHIDNKLPIAYHALFYMLHAGLTTAINNTSRVLPRCSRTWSFMAPKMIFIKSGSSKLQHLQLTMQVSV